MTNCMICNALIDDFDGGHYIDDIVVCDDCAKQYENLTSKNTASVRIARDYFKTYLPRIKDSNVLMMLTHPNKRTTNSQTNSNTTEARDLTNKDFDNEKDYKNKYVMPKYKEPFTSVIFSLISVLCFFVAAISLCIGLYGILVNKPFLLVCWITFGSSFVSGVVFKSISDIIFHLSVIAYNTREIANRFYYD